MCYIALLFLTVSVGNIQFGYMIGSWNAAAAAYSKKLGWTDPKVKSHNIMVVQTVTTAGAAIGAVLQGSIAHKGRLKCLYLANIVLCLGSIMSLTVDFTVLCMGRFVYGLSVGGFSIICPKFISETAPLEINGPAGALI